MYVIERKTLNMYPLNQYKQKLLLFDLFYIRLFKYASTYLQECTIYIYNFQSHSLEYYVFCHI